MSTDRELLELAAKAFWGDEIDDVCSVEWSDQDNCILYTHGYNQDHNGADRAYRWNPLEENHDAFELAVKLRIAINLSGEIGIAASALKGISAVLTIDEMASLDDYAATRLAIVRCAAEIGKAKEDK